MKSITVNYANFRLLQNVTEQYTILNEFYDVISVEDNTFGTLPGTVHVTTVITGEVKMVSS